MNYPQGKTPAKITINTPLNELKHGDVGYIDGYVLGADQRPYAVFVREDGYIALASSNQMRAMLAEEVENQTKRSTSENKKTLAKNEEVEGDFEFAINQLIKDVRMGTRSNFDMIHRWDKARGTDWFLSTRKRPALDNQNAQKQESPSCNITLPEITEEIWEEYKDTDLMGLKIGVSFDYEAHWTQLAVDFACLLKERCIERSNK